MCTVFLPPGDNPIAVNKYINKYINIYLRHTQQLILKFTQLNATSSMATCFGRSCDHHKANLYRSCALNVLTIWDPIMCTLYFIYGLKSLLKVFTVRYKKAIVRKVLRSKSITFHYWSLHCVCPKNGQVHWLVAYLVKHIRYYARSPKPSNNCVNFNINFCVWPKYRMSREECARLRENVS